MARTIATIKASITTDFMSNETLSTAYGFTPGASFDSVFSKVSVENILFYIVSVAIWTLETLFDTHKTEVSNLIDTKKPHRLKWYRDKALAFQLGRSLDEDSDTYDEIVDSEMIIKWAAAVEYQGKLYIKVAKGVTDKEALSGEEQTALTAYFDDIKDAGVKYEIVNKDADHYAAELDIYYDPMVYAATGTRLDTGSDTVRDTIKDYAQNQIPFNGEYRNASLIDVLQALDGVIIPELIQAKTVSDENYQAAESGAIPWETIQAKHLPQSGYYKVYEDSDLVLNFIAYQTISST
jgi:hypothetical protein